MSGKDRTTWGQMSRVSFQLIIENWRRIEPSLLLFDGKSKYDSWSIASDKTAFTGMRHTTSNEAHGICRLLRKGAIYERSYLNGKIHGLSIETDSDKMRIQLYRRDQLLASFIFDRSFSEIARDDKDGWLDHLSPQYFNQGKSQSLEEGKKEQSTVLPETPDVTLMETTH